MAPHSSTLAWRIPGMGEPGGLPSVGSHRVGHDLAAAAAPGPDQLYVSFLNYPTLFSLSYSHRKVNSKEVIPSRMAIIKNKC